MVFYTYLWLREDGTPYYVGKGSGRRAFIRVGHGVSRPQDDSRILIQEFPSEQDAFAAEKFLIAYYGRRDMGVGVLRNRTDGGEGTSGCPLGGKKSHELYPDMARENGLRSAALGHLAKARIGASSKAGKIAVESGQLARLRTPEHQKKAGRAGGKISGPINNCLRWNIRRGKPCVCRTHILNEGAVHATE